MRRMIAIATMLVLITTASLSLAAPKMDSQQGVWISGKVATIEDGILGLRRQPNSEIFRISATNDQLKGIRIGDRVSVRALNGWAVSIRDTGKRAAKSSTNLAHRRG